MNQLLLARTSRFGNLQWAKPPHATWLLKSGGAAILSQSLRLLSLTPKLKTATFKLGQQRRLYQQLWETSLAVLLPIRIWFRQSWWDAAILNRAAIFPSSTHPKRHARFFSCLFLPPEPKYHIVYLAYHRWTQIAHVSTIPQIASHKTSLSLTGIPAVPLSA